MNPTHAQIMIKLMDIAGSIISQYISRPNYNEQLKIYEKYYNRLKEIEERRKEEKPVKIEIKESGNSIKGIAYYEKEKTKGTACLPCSRDHLSTVSASLNEAVRFARREGIENKEVLRRIGIAIDELNIMERIDLSAENITKLPKEERELARWILDKARELRHEITDIQTVEDLEKAAAKAAELRTQYLEKLWEITRKKRPEEIISKVCSGLKGEEKEKCERSIRELLKEDKGKIKEILKKLE